LSGKKCKVQYYIEEGIGWFRMWSRGAVGVKRTGPYLEDTSGRKDWARCRADGPHYESSAPAGPMSRLGRTGLWFEHLDKGVKFEW